MISLAFCQDVLVLVKLNSMTTSKTFADLLATTCFIYHYCVHVNIMDKTTVSEKAYFIVIQ